MKLPPLLLIALLASVAQPRASRAEHPVTIQLEKVYDQFHQALADRDIDKVMSFIDPAASITDAHGKTITAAEYRESLNKHLSQQRNYNASYKFKDVRATANGADIYIEINYTFETKIDRYKGWVPFTGTLTAEEHWEKQGGEWRLAKSRTLRERSSIDAQWLANYNKALEDAVSLSMPCNFSTNGCR